MERKRNRLFKKIAAVTLLAAMIVMNMAMTVLAEGETVDTSKSVSLTLTKYEAADGDKTGLDENVTGGEWTGAGDRKPLEGVNFTVLKVADMVQENTDGTVGIYYRLTEAGAAVLGTGFTKDQDYTITQLNNWVTGKKATDSAFDNLTTVPGAVTGTTDSTGQVKFTSGSATGNQKKIDGQGLYLVVETHAPNTVTERTAPFFVSLPMTDRTNLNAWLYDVYAYPKNETGSIEFDKKISKVNDADDGVAANNESAEAKIGDVITFQIPFKMVIPSDGLTKWNIVDTMSKGLTLEKAAATAASTDVTVQIKNGDNWDTVPSGNYTVNESSPNASGETTVTIAFTETYINTLNSATDKTPEFMVTYKAKLNEKAVLGNGENANKAQVYYRDGSMDTADADNKTPEKETKVYTWGVALEKKGEGDAALKDVEFKLSEGSTTYKFKKETTNGYYYLSNDADAEETLKTDDNGKLVIRGLKSGTYDLTETKTASGYVLLKGPVEIVITGSNTDGTATATVNETAANMAADTLNTSSTTALVPVTVVNSKGLFNLPSTGGTGTALITMIGIVLVIISSVLLVRMGVKKRSEMSK